MGALHLELDLPMTFLLNMVMRVRLKTVLGSISSMIGLRSVATKREIVWPHPSCRCNVHSTPWNDPDEEDAKAAAGCATSLRLALSSRLNCSRVRSPVFDVPLYIRAQWSGYANI